VLASAGQAGWLAYQCTPRISEANATC
jgi:hypothetical protein